MTDSTPVVVKAKHLRYVENRVRAALDRARFTHETTIGVVTDPTDTWGWRLVEGAPGVVISGQRPADLVASLVEAGQIVIMGD